MLYHSYMSRMTNLAKKATNDFNCISIVLSIFFITFPKLDSWVLDKCLRVNETIKKIDAYHHNFISCSCIIFWSHWKSFFYENSTEVFCSSPSRRSAVVLPPRSHPSATQQPLIMRHSEYYRLQSFHWGESGLRKTRDCKTAAKFESNNTIWVYRIGMDLNDMKKIHIFWIAVTFKYCISMDYARKM